MMIISDIIQLVVRVRADIFCRWAICARHSLRRIRDTLTITVLC